MNQDHLSVFQNMPVFGGLDEKTLDYLLSEAESDIIEPGSYLFHENDKGDAMYVITFGKLAVLKSWQDQEYILAYLSTGDCVGEMELIDITPRSASVIAVERTSVIRIPRKSIFSLYRENLEQFTTIQMNMGREVSRRLREADQKLFHEHVKNERFQTLSAGFKIKKPPK